MLPAFVSFLSGITLALLHSMWQAVVLWVIYIAINSTLATAKTRFNFALSLLIFQVVLSVATFYYLTGTDISPVRFITDATASDSGPTFFYLTNILGATYLLFQCFQLFKLNTNRISLKSFVTASQMTALPQWRMYVSTHARKLKITKRVRVYLSRTLQSPVTIGFFKPVILLPLSMVNGLTPPQIEAVLLHELAHISRNDYVVNVFLQTLQQLFFFNPFIVNLLKICYRERENSCDDVVMQYRYDKLEYSRALLYLHQAELDWSMMGLSTGTDYELLQRIRRIVQEDKPARTSCVFNWKLGTAIVVSLMMAATPFFIHDKNRNESPARDVQRLGLYNYQKGYAWLRALRINNAESFSLKPAGKIQQQAVSRVVLPTTQPESPQQPEFASSTYSMPTPAMPELVLNMQRMKRDEENLAEAKILPASTVSPLLSSGSPQTHGTLPNYEEYYQHNKLRVADEQRMSLDAKQMEMQDLQLKLEERLQQAAEEIVYSHSDAEVLQSLIARLLELKSTGGNEAISRKLGEDMIEAFKRTELARDMLQDSKKDYEELLKHLHSLLVSRRIKL